MVDPYAKAVGVNGNRGMIVDLNDTDPEGWSDDSFHRVDYAADAVVWEVSVRDFSAAASSGVSEENRGKFLAFTEDDTKLDGLDSGVSTCVAYLKELGVNYVQINPFYDFASIDEAESLDEQYNWGYDPKNYNVPEGSYSSDPYDGRVRIKECKQMIQALHSAGIGVIMDVVYNHTYLSEESFFNQLVPSYYYRVKEDGSWSNGSGCGNDVATERKMVSKFIRESVAYWAQEYHIDGFRFDLMGLMDVDTMNGIRTDLDALPDGKKIIMYGEAWNMSTAVSSGTVLATQDNLYQLSQRIGAFNDTGRDAIKGSNFNAAEKGFVQDGSSKGGVRDAIDGNGAGWAQVPNQCVNYASCHDNLTLYDKLTASVYNDKKYTQRRENLVAMNRLSAATVMMSRGMPFMLAGEELGRTKEGDENSYQSSLSINQINWKNRYLFTSLSDYYQGLLKIRKEIPALRDATGEYSSIDYLDASEKNVIAYTVSGVGSPTLVVALNGDPKNPAEVTLPDGDWVIIANEIRAGLTSLGDASGSVTVPASSAYILIDESSFRDFGQSAVECLLYIRYKDKKSGLIVCEERLTGNMKDSYVAATPSEILFNYNILSRSALSGTFNKEFDVIEVECEAYEGDYSTVTIRYVDEEDTPIANTVVMTNRVGQQYYTPSIPGVKEYALDLDNLPDNGAGLYTEEPIEVVYRYHAADSGGEENEEKDGEDDQAAACSANVIYTADEGTILELKSYKGAAGDKLGIEYLEFDGYEYYNNSNDNAVFDETELNVLLCYQRPKADYLIYLIIAGVVIILLGGVALIAGTARKRRMNAIDIEE